MATISEYQRENLKSSLVGTAGADNSSAQAFESIAQSTGRVADYAFQLATKRKEAKDFAIANESILSLDVDMENSLRDHQQAMKNFEGSPRERASIFQSAAEKMVYDRAQAAPNDQVRRAIIDQGTQMVQSRTKREIEAADRNQGLIAYTKINDAQKLSEEEAARIGADETLSFGEKIARMEELLTRSKTTIDAAAVVLDPKQTQQFQQNSPAGIMKAAATGMLAKKPEELLALLNRKDKDGKTPFDGVFSPQEIEEFRKEAVKSLENFETRREVEEIQANLDHVSEAFNLAKNGDSVAALAMTETLPDGPLKSSMRQSILREGITEADRTEKVYKLMTKLSTLYEDRRRHTKGEGAKKKVNMKATLQELVDFQAEVVEAHALGDLTDSKRNEYLTEFLPDLQNKVKKNKLAIKSDPLNTEASLIAKVWRGITQVAPAKEDAVNIHQDFQLRLKESGDFSPAGVNKALIGALDEHRRNRFPKSIFLAESVNSVLDHNKSLVATGVKGRTEASPSGKIPPAAKIIIETDPDTNKKYRVVYDGNGNMISETEL